MDTMQFDDLMNMAQSNIRLGQKKIQNFVPPKFSVAAKPKKLTAKDKQLSEGVKKFLEKKQEEERRKAMEEKVKKEKLVQLRNQDRKATRRVAAMLKMTKSANKAVMSDAVDCLNDSLVGQDAQPDEDDFGFVSDSAQVWQKKLMDKYKQMPLSNPTEMKPPSAKPLPIKSKHAQSRSAPSKYSYEDVPPMETVKKKPAKAAPPPVLNFQDMLKLAEKKSQEPVKPLEPKPLAKVPTEKEAFEFGRPMTARQKKQYMIEKAAREKIDSGSFSLAAIPAANNISKLSKISFKKKDPKDGEKSPPSAPSVPLKDSSSHDLSTSNRKDTSSRKDIPDGRKSESAVTIRELPASCFKKPPPSANGVFDKTKSKSSDSGALYQKKPGSSSAVAEKSKLSASSSSINHKRDSDRPIPTQRPAVPRFDQKSLNPVVHPRSPPPASRFHQRPDGQQRNRPPKRPCVIESDEEYDSEMDDFIDDSEDHMDISAMIRKITGYDRRKFANVDDDDIKESSAREQMLEEARSARIGRKEDLEDIRMEEEEKRRKALLKKKMKR